jgi:type 1 glutamine amidotransferase/nicotinamidase-related amidase
MMIRPPCSNSPGCWLTPAFILLSTIALHSSFADPAPPPPSTELHLLTRTRTETAPHSARFEVVEKPVGIDPKQTALIICDLWDKHTCDGATQRVAAMAPRVDALAKALRARGALIVHAPSDTMAFYKDSPQRKRAIDAPLARTPIQFHWNSCDLSVEPPLPIDDSDGGCDTNTWAGGKYPWTREHPAVEVFSEDAVSDQGREIFNLFVQHGIRHVLFCGVHTNMCVLGRSFGIRAMHKLGLKPMLVRDLTDTMYNPRSFPYVPHDRGTDLVIEHVEKFWCPTLLSSDILGDPKPFTIVFAIGEQEYHAHENLSAFAKDELEKLPGVKIIIVNTDSTTDMPGLEVLKQADLLVMFMRRRTLPDDQLNAFKTYFDSGRPVIGLRTACHSFQNWLEFDSIVFGSHYGNHYPGKKSNMTIRACHNADDSPLLRGIAKTWQTPTTLYKMLPLNEGCTPLLNGIWQGNPAEPVAWTTKYHGGRVFFTALGATEDFNNKNFRRLLLNGFLWAMDKPIPRGK